MALRVVVVTVVFGMKVVVKVVVMEVEVEVG